MSGSGDLYDVLMDRLNDPYIRGRIRRALTMDLVLDTWLNGEREETFTPEAQEIISRAAEEFTRQSMETRAVFPENPMPEGYVRSVFQELLSSTALYQSQKYKGVREVDTVEAVNAEAILRRFVTTERDGLTSVGGLYFVISAHEDLNAIRYYRRMKREDFLLGTLHRPWSDMMLTNQFDVYLRMGLVKVTFIGEGEMIELTTRGDETLGYLRHLLEEAGEFEWRSNAQRWVIFGETDYDRVFQAVLPDTNRITKQFIDGLEIPSGARVLEIGAGTGRATLDLGLAQRIKESGGRLVALEPSGALIQSLRRKCLKCGADIDIVQGVVEALPFPDDSFDMVVSVGVLHFTDLEKAVAEMARVVKPGGQVSSLNGIKWNLFDIPMVAMWFRPLAFLAEELGVPLGERQGIPSRQVPAEFHKAGLQVYQTTDIEYRVIATDHRSFEQFVLKGAALYQNVLSRLPFHERWTLLDMLHRTGGEMVGCTTPQEQQMVCTYEMAYSSVPVQSTVEVPVRAT